MVLVADLAEFQIESGKGSKLHPFSNHFLLKSIVDLTSMPDLNLHEKVSSGQSFTLVCVLLKSI